MKMKIILLSLIGVIILLVIGFASAQLNQNIQTDSSRFEKPDCDEFDGLRNCEKTCNGNCTGECDGSCNCIEQRNCNEGYGLGEGTCNKRCGPRDGTGNRLGNCHK